MVSAGNKATPFNGKPYHKRILWLERKFEKQPSLKSKCVETINEFIEKGHARKLLQKARKEEQNEVNYIPHQAVNNMNKASKI